MTFYAVRPKKILVSHIYFWTDFSPWKVCPFLIIYIASIAAIFWIYSKNTIPLEIHALFFYFIFAPEPMILLLKNIHLNF
ncbi:hypothetical protein COK06_22920 [Bacillus cereus]|nr:hypothetical protein COK06_22920 [Bacillus cereus]